MVYRSASVNMVVEGGSGLSQISLKNKLLSLQLMFGHGQWASRYRLALEVYSGQSIMGEFSFQDESYLGLGIYYDW